MQVTSRNIARGFTLVEVMVAASLTVVITTLISQFVVPALGYQARGLAQSELLRQGYRAMDGLVRDLRLSPAALLSFDPATSQLCGRFRTDWTPDGTALYSAECWVYGWDAGRQRLARTVLAIGASNSESLTQPYRISACELRTALVGARWKTLCTCLTAFEFKHRGVEIQAPSGQYEVSMSLGQQGQRLEIHQTVTPRQSR